MVDALETVLEQLLLGGGIPGGGSVRAQEHAVPGPRKRNVGGGAVPATASSRVLLLREEGFLDQEKSLGEIREELRVRGWVYPITSLSGTVQTLVQRRELRRALGSNGTKKVYRYVRP